MSKRSVVLCGLLSCMVLAGCGSRAIPVQPGPVDDMRDAIAIAIEDGDEAQVKQLIESQPLLTNEPIPNLNNQTPLHCAARAGNAGIVRYLLEQGADPYAMDDEGQLPQDIAQSAGAGEEVTELLRVQ